MRAGRCRRAVALILSWVFTATTAWSAAPLAAAAAEALPAPEPQAGPPPGPGATLRIFGPQRYVRTTGPKNVYTTAVTVPAWIVSPFTMHVQNGEPNGTYRVSSAWIEVNGTQVAATPNDFNQNVGQLDRSVSLAPQTTLRVTLASKPTSYLSISLAGTNADHTAPTVSIAAPAPGSIGKDTPTHLLVKYLDLVGAGEPAASGVDTSTLKVTLDGVDRTGLFTRRSDEASADLALAEGAYILRATVRDQAGNTGEGTSEFRVDRTPPVVAVVEPPKGAYLPTLRPSFRVTYRDDVAVDLASLRIRVNGADRTSEFARGPEEATADLDLPAGGNEVVAEIADRAGNAGMGSAQFNLDVQPPRLAIAQPVAASRHGSPDVEVLVQYGDDQALDVGSFRATLDGRPLDLTPGSEGAIGTAHGLADGPHRIDAQIKDRAGNLTPASVFFSVDTTVPFIRIVQPPPGFIIREATPQILVEYSDAQGIDLATLHVLVNGIDRTGWCVAGADSARCTIPPADRLPEGGNAVTAEIRDLAANRATAASSFTVDTVPPTGTLQAPVARTSAARPLIQLVYGDGSGTGVVPSTVHVFVDGAEVTSSFVTGATGATGVLDEPLADGLHAVRLTMADLAGNDGEVTGSFTVDTQPPAGAFLAPANDSFINDATPELRLAYGDGAGTGVDLATVKVLLRSGDETDWRDITGYVQVSAEGAVGAVPDTAPLPDGTHHLRMEFKDRAGNPAAADSSFELDTVRPVYSIEIPAADGHVPTRTPAFRVTYGDDRSRVDTDRIIVQVDGADVTSLMTVTPAELTGTLPADHALAEGPHQVAVQVFDRAGNQATVVPHEFTVDTLPPEVVRETPRNGDYIDNPQPLIRFTYSDPNGDAPDGTIDPASVRVSVDGADRTAEFQPAADHAQATLPLADLTHTAAIEVVDWAGNTTTVQGSFTIDTQPPVLAVSVPGDGSYHRASPVTVSGQAQDADPQLVVECRTPAGTVPAGLFAGSFSCAVPLAEGPNAVEVTARDRFGRATSVTRGLVLDTQPPQPVIAQPRDGDFTSSHQVDVSGTVTDANPGRVQVEGVEAEVSGQSFVARGVPLGEGPSHTLRAVAEDLAGNTGEAAVTVRIDRMPPSVQINSPAAGSYLKTPSIEVTGTASDPALVSVEVNGQPAELTGPGTGTATFRATVPAVEGPFQITASARDAAANEGVAQVGVVVDTIAPVITITERSEGPVTRAQSLRLAGTVSDASPVTLQVDGAPVPVGGGGAFEATIALAAEGPRHVTLEARDAAGNTATQAVDLLVDRTPPALEVVSPSEGAALGSLPVTVQGMVHDATDVTVTVDGAGAVRIQEGWQASLPVLPEGPHAFTVTATDAAGNQTTVVRNVILDFGPPVVTITAPESGTLTRESATTVTGVVTDRSAVTVTVAGVIASVTGAGTFAFTAPSVPLQEGDNHLVARATDQTGRFTEAETLVTRDSTPPVIVLVAPEKVSRGRPGQAQAAVTDNLAVAQVVVRVTGAGTCAAGGGTFTSPPYNVALTVPDCAAAGDTLTVVAEATDTAGNTATASRGVRVVSDGVITGQVLSDVTGLPLPDATVRTLSGASATFTTDERGRYSMPTGDLALVLRVEKAGFTSVERAVAIESGVGTVPVDARLTALAEPKTIGAGETFTSGTLTLSGPPGTYRLTPLSAQGLPGLLPMGWSPLATFDLVEAPAAPFTATVTGLPAASLHLVTYSSTSHAWSLVASLGALTDGALSFEVPALGAYALVTPDDADMAIPAPGEILAGVDAQVLPVTVTSQGTVTPPTMPPTGGTAKGLLVIQSPTPLPSGTVVQAEVTETFKLASGEVASEETRREDIVLYRYPAPAGAALAAELPITPSRTFQTAELTEGEVTLDILSGREGVRGQTGGLEAVQLDAAEARLVVPAHALADDTAVALESHELSSFLPAAPGLTPLSEVVVDFATQTLGLGAELSVAAAGVAPDATFLVAKVERDFTLGIPRLVVVALAELVGDRVVSRPTPGLAGITKGGRYVVYRSAGPVGFVAGLVTTSAGPARAVVSAVGNSAQVLPFVALSDFDGRYLLPALPGPNVTLAALIPGTSFQVSAPAAVVGGETTALNLALAGTVTIATVTPADGTVAVPTSVQVHIESAAPLRASSITPGSVQLVRSSDHSAVLVRTVLSASGKLLTVIPYVVVVPPEKEKPALDFTTTYTLEATSLVDVFGGLVSVAPVSFTTRPDTTPAIDYGQLKLGYPDDNGVVQVTAPAGTFPPGTTILLINTGNGVVLSLTADNDGAVSGELPATIDHRILVTVTDPAGRSTSFERSQFVAPDGRTAVGAGGGVVEAVDGSGAELRIPEGALDKGVTLKLTSLSADQVPDKPELPEANFGSGLKIEASDKTVFKKEVDLAFPVPDFSQAPPDQRPARPEDAFYYVYKRIQGPSGVVLFEALDDAFVKDGKVVTASPPFSGYANGWNSWDPVSGPTFGSFSMGGVIESSGTSIAMVMSTHNALLPGASTYGVITGKVLRPVFQKGATTPDYVGVPGVQVSRKDARDSGANVTVSYTQADGRFTFSDPHFTTGTVELLAEPAGGGRFTATAYAVEKSDSKIESDPALASLLSQGLFRNVATANVVLPAEQAPPPAPRISTHLMQTVDGNRQEITGIVVGGTPLVVGFKATNPSDGVVTQAAINGTDYAVKDDPLLQTQPKNPLAMDRILQDEFVPGQPGTYTVTSTALPAFGPPVYSTYSFRVIAEGGGLTSVAGAPSVITARVAPKDGATGVPVTVFPEVAFTEPVRNVTASGGSPTVALRDAAGNSVGLKLLALAVGADGQPEPIDDFTDPGRAVTSITLQPLAALRYDTTYTLSLSSAIVDLDKDAQGNPAPNSLAAYQTSFTTFGPEALGGSEDTPRAAGLVVFDDKGYFLETQYLGGVGGAYQSGQILVYDLSDPAAPRNLSNPASPEVPATVINYPPRDIAGETLHVDNGDGTTTEQKWLTVVAGPRTYFFTQGELVYYTEIRSTPSNLFLYDVTEGGKPRWIGAANITNDIIDGTPNRVVMKDGTAYIATLNKGIQVVDLAQTRQGFPEVGEPAGIDLFNINKQLFTGGINQSAVISIPVTDPPDPPPGTYALKMPLYDLKVADLVVDGTSQRLVLATGQRRQVGLVIADPVSTQKLYQGALASAAGSIESGWAIAVTKAADGRDLALVGGYGLVTDGGAGSVLAVVNVSNPRQPAVLAFLKLEGLGSVGDLLVKDNTVIVSGGQATVDPVTGQPGLAVLVDITDPARPAVAGTLGGVASRMVLADDVLFSTERSFLQASPTPLGGVRVATFGPIVLLLDKEKNVLPRIKLPKNTETFVRASVPAAGDTVEGVEVSIIEKDGSVRKQTGSIPTRTTLTLRRDPETGQYLAPLNIVDKDCALELDYNDFDEQIIKTPCPGDLESGPWTQLKVKLPPAYGGLERITDIRAFRLVAIGDSLTQGVQHGIVVHQDQRYSYPAQLAGQINEYLKQKYGQQVVFKQAMIAEPGIGKPPLRNPHGDGNVGPDGFPVPGRLNPTVQPVNNLGMSGSRVAHLHTAKKGKWPKHMDPAETPWTCKDSPEKCEKYPSPIDNPDEPKSVWRYVLAPPALNGESFGTAVDQACQLDPSLLLVFIGNNDALNAPVGSDMRELTSVADFQDRYNALMEAVQRCTEGRADIMVGTIPDVASIPHMRNVGEVVGAMPFTLPGLPEKAPVLGFDIADPFTRQFEKIFIEPRDEHGECLGNDQNGACLGGDLGGAKVGIGTLGKTLAVQDLVSLGSTLSLLLSQAQVMRRLAGFKTITLDRKQVMSPDNLAQVQFNVDAFNRHITGERWAAGHGWPVMDMNRLFKDRTTDAAKNEPTLLNGLFTGTPRPVRREGDLFRRGMGNTMLGWDGVHPNSAGYSLAANEAIRALQGKLNDADYGGLEKGTMISPVPEETITKLLKGNYLSLKWSRIYGWQDLISTVR